MVAIASNPGKCEQIAQILKALGHPIRLRIVALLAEEELHVGALSERLGVPQAVVSQQLSILRMRRLVERTREQGRSIYSILEPRLRQLVECMEGCRVD